MKKNKKVKIGDLSKGVEKYEKEKLAVREKEMRPATKATLGFIRNIFWFIVIVVLALGVFQIIRSKQPRIVENIHRYEFTVAESEKAKTLAESFVKSYLTYGKISDGDYMQKLDQYVAGTLILGRPGIAAGESEVTDTKVWEVQKVDDTHSNIIVKADVKIINENKMISKYDQNGQMIQVPTEEEKTYYISVPIAAKDDKVIINDYPAFIAPPGNADMAEETFSAENSLSDTDLKALKKTLEDFMAVYYSGTEGQIKYFFKEDKHINGLNGEFVFNSIRTISGYETGENKATVIAVSEVKEAAIGAVFNQRHLFEFEKIDGRWVITNMKNRGI